DHQRLDEAQDDDRKAAQVEKADRQRHAGHGQDQILEHLHVGPEEHEGEQHVGDVDRPVPEPEGENAEHRHDGTRCDRETAQRGAQRLAHERGLSPSPSFTASSAALVRSLTCSFRKMLATWFFTVCSLMKRRFPISRFDSPVASSFRISSSRAVRASSCSRKRSSARSRSNSRRTRPAISPESIGSPAAARSTVLRISSGDTFFSRYPTAPALSAANPRSESEYAVSMTTRISGCFSRSARVSSIPPSPGSSTSIRTICGRPCARSALHSSSPLPAV